MRIDSRIAERLKKIQPSSTLAITTKAKKLRAEGKDVVSLAAGEPDFDTPPFVKDAAIEAIKSGFTKYTPTTGVLELKKLICSKLKKDNGLSYEPSQIVVSCGAKHSLFNTLFVLVEKGDEVLIPSPYWVSYPEMVHLCEASVRFIKTSPQNNFKVTAADIERHIHSKTKALILNSPSNPCGAVYTKEELKAIASVCVDAKVFIISDEIYEKLLFDGLRHFSVASLGDDIYNLTVTVNGLSKSYSMTGWRIGYLAASNDIVTAISKVQDHSTSCPSSISQKAAIAALEDVSDFTDTVRVEFEKRRDYIIDRLNGIEKLGYVKPQGAFYLFCDIHKTGMDSFTFANRLLDEASVAVIPGAAFGRDDFIRLSFATSLEQITKGLDRIESWTRRST